MHTQRPHLLLRVPTQSRQSFSFCNAAPGPLAKWLGALPRANLGETARLLFQAQEELNELQLRPGERLPLLELLRPEINQTCKHLERHFLDKPTALDLQGRKVAGLCQSLQKHLASGYKLVVQEQIAQPSPAPSGQPSPLAVAIQRAVRSLYAALIRACQLYAVVPDDAWLELHLLYQIAVKQGLERLSIADPTSGGGMSIEQSYLAAMLLGAARCNQLRQRSIGKLGDLLEGWSVLARLQPATEPGSQVIVAPPIDGPPRYRSLIPAEQLSDWLGIDAAPLAQMIEKYLRLPTDQRHLSSLMRANEVDDDLLRHLCSAWDGLAERSFHRSPGQGDLELCIGMSAVHFFLSGECAFDEMVKDVNTAEAARREKELDPWSTVFGNSAGTTVDTGPAMLPIAFEPAGAPPSVSYPTYRFAIVDQSAEGYRLSWPEEVPGQLQVGELIALRDLDSHWILATVRWVRQLPQGGAQMGVQLMTRHAHPCAMRLLRGDSQGSLYLRALMLPERAAQDAEASLIAPRMPFSEGQKVSILDNNREYEALLTRRLTGTPSFSQFAYKALEMIHEEMPVTTRPTERSSTAEDFDSVWELL